MVIKRMILIATTLLLMTGCAQFKKDWKHTQSYFGGLHRKVTLYNCSGDTIHTWTGTFKVEADSGPCAAFVTDDGREIKVAGTWVVEEIKK